jgi:thiol-disulfide isomerase/thioredoxin
MTSNNPNSQLSYLTNHNFTFGKGNKGPLLMNDIPGLSIVFFFAEKCSHCHTAYPVFAEASKMNKSAVKFTIVNLTKNPDIITRSAQTIMPIKYTPLIVMYINGKPYARFDGKVSSTEILKFIGDIIEIVKSQSKTISKKEYENKQATCTADGEDCLPYNVLCDTDGDSCYLMDEELEGSGKCSGGECCFLTDGEL